MALTDLEAIVDDLTRDDAAKLTASDRTEGIALAVSRYSQDRPRSLVEDVTAVAGYYQPLPASWESGFSQILTIEYPTGERPPAVLRPDDWTLYTDPSQTRILLYTYDLAGGETIRVTYTVAHVLDVSTDTIPTVHREAVAHYAASFLCMQLATLYSGSRDSTFGADAVAHQTKATEYQARAKEYRRRYFEGAQIRAGHIPGTSVNVDLDINDSLGGDRIFHPRRRR